MQCRKTAKNTINIGLTLSFSIYLYKTSFFRLACYIKKSIVGASYRRLKGPCALKKGLFFVNETSKQEGFL